jgi:rhodanese-related sulfurtransferase
MVKVNVAKPGILALLCFLVVPLVLLNGCLGLGDFRPNDQIIKDITLEEAFALMEDNRYDEDFVIIDVRTPEEYAGGYIEKAINLDYYSETFADELDQLGKEKIYLIYSRTDQRSGEALDMMAELGFREVYNMLGGIVRWEELKLPTVK